MRNPVSRCLAATRWSVPLIIVTIISIDAVPVAGQQAAPAFDVVSVKPHRDGDLGIRIDTEGHRFIATNVPVRSLLRLAYELEDFQISGAPAWVDADRFDIEASAPHELAPMGGPFTGSAELRSMVRRFLAARFALIARLETRDSPVFALIPARTDAALPAGIRKSSTDCAALTAALTPDREPPRCGVQIAPGTIRLEGEPLSQLATVLQGFVHRPVADRTGLTGNYDVEVHWEARPFPNAGDQTGPSLSTALQEQVGLKLENARGLVPLLVIDRIAQPTPN